MDALTTEPAAGIDSSASTSDADVGEVRAPERGASVGRYVLLERLGAGGMGVVWAAWDPELDRRVAIKLISDRAPELHRQLRARLRREAQAMARLIHPNVVKVFDVGEADGRLFVAMEYVEGLSLRRWLDAERRGGPEIVARFRAAGEGLAAAHAQGIVHRDFKPDNVLVADDGRVVVLDFGLASWGTSDSSGSRPIETTPDRSGDGEVDEALDDLEPDHSAPPIEGSGDREQTVADGSAVGGTPSELLETNPGFLTMPGAVLGTPAYMAPEQHRGQPTNTRSDQFSFCAALWEALTGRLPFGRGPLVLARARTAKLGAFERRDVPASVEAALRRGLAWQPDERWTDMRALLDALDPPVRKRRWAAVIVPMFAGALGLAAAQLGEDQAPSADPGEQCEAAGRERMARVWSEAVVAELAAAFADRGRHADETWPYLRAELDRWSASWIAIDQELCDRYGRFAGLERGVRQDQLACLDRQLGHLEQLVELLASVSEAELPRTFDLLATLPNPQRCRDVGGAPEREPVDVDPKEVAELDRAIVRAELELQLSRLDPVDASSSALFERTKRRGLEPQHQRVAALRAKLLVDKRRPGEGIEAALSGLEAAERSGDPTLRLDALLGVAWAHALAGDTIAAQRWLRPARALASELVLDRSMRARLAMTEARVAMIDAHFIEALAAWDRALAATNPEHDRFEYIEWLHHRATVLFMSNQPREGLEQLRRCEQMYGENYGPNHRRVLDIRLDIGHTLEKLGRHAESRETYLAVARDLEAFHGEPTDLSIAAYSHAAYQLGELGDCEGAVAEFDPLIGPAREVMAYPSAVLGNLLRRRTRLCDFSTPEAIAFGEQTIALYREALTDEHASTAATHSELAIALLVAGDPARAKLESGRAIELFTSVDPEAKDPVARLRLYEAQAVNMLARQRLGEAEALAGAADLLARLAAEDLPPDRELPEALLAELGPIP